MGMLSKAAYKLRIRHCEGIIGKWYEYKLYNHSTGQLMDADSIDDTGQGEETATKQIHQVIERKFNIRIQ